MERKNRLDQAARMNDLSFSKSYDISMFDFVLFLYEGSNETTISLI